MSDYFTPTMRLYVDQLVDWERYLRLRNGGTPDVTSEVGAYDTILETTAQLAASFERPAREGWHEHAELTPDGGAQPPKHIRDAYDQLAANGLVSLTVGEEYGGAALPALLNGFVMEMLSRADASLFTVVGLQTGVAGDIEKYGDETLRREWLPRFVAGEVQASMDLTEPKAGSDLGGISTRAADQPDGTLRVDGSKIFITNGGAEVHLVLARDGDSFEQSKGTTNGLSLVLVPRHLPDGSQNGVRVPRLESKIGIHGSPTCEVVFENAKGWRLYHKGQGFRAMLDLMNNARLAVAAQSIGLAAAAFHDAVRYAGERQQFGEPVAKQPLVLSMLSKMGVNLESARALLYRTFELIDRNVVRERALSRGDLSGDEAEEMRTALEHDLARVRLLTPLSKYYATEICTDVTRDAVQVYGGLGYTMDADVAKLHADALIMTIYEGTSEIQASFALREMGKGALGSALAQLRDELGSIAADPKRAELAKLVDGSLGRIQQCAQVLFTDLPYALLRAKMIAEMLINAKSATELLRQVSADEARIDIANAFIHRRVIESEAMARRIEQNHEGRIEREMRILERFARTEA
ncbi:MAG: acyl-CoA dehydrogenase family protein [Proteobacteria bacterium]|nr:acyl-CoA dehydrogenase family protein [Pseudomonadota bacterium]